MRCNRCSTDRSEEEFRIDSHRKTGRTPYCRRCLSEIERNKRVNIPLEERLPTLKCKMCKKDKPRADFPISKTHPSQFCNTCRAKRDIELRAAREKEHKALAEERKYTPKQKEEFFAKRTMIKQDLINKAGGCCSSCGLKLGETYPVCCFDFHHRDPSQKQRGVATLIAYASRRKSSDTKYNRTLLDEVEKCDVLCSLCHRKFHFATRKAGANTKIKKNGIHTAKGDKED